MRASLKPYKKRIRKKITDDKKNSGVKGLNSIINTHVISDTQCKVIQFKCHYLPYLHHMNSPFLTQVQTHN